MTKFNSYWLVMRIEQLRKIFVVEIGEVIFIEQ